MSKTYNELFVSIRNSLNKISGCHSSLEARTILSHASAKSKEELTRDMSLFASDGTEMRAREMLERRKQGEPLAYIVGQWEFYGLPVNVDKNVLIPRADTEVVADVTIKAARRLPKDARVLDLCCGSGCIGIALAANVPNIKVTMADISKEALKIARSNVTLNNLGGRVTCIEADAAKPPQAFLGSFELIVSNPPYIPSSDMQTLDRSVIGFEPPSALDGGEDGLDFYRSIALLWTKVLKPGGCMIFECGIRQAVPVKYLLRVNGYENIEVTADLAGIDRAVSGWLPEQQ